MKTYTGNPLFGDPVTPYYKWFAWYPVKTWNCGWQWLRMVHYRKIQLHTYLDHGIHQWWQYML